MINKTLDHYTIMEKLGAGGMGEVYRAEDTKLDRHVALKVLPDVFASDPERMARFEREAKLLASLNHPNIAAIYGLEEAEGKRFLVMELVEGETLSQRLVQGPLSIEDTLDVCQQIAEAVEAAHEKGIIHRDLKPANIKITPVGRVKVLDFGLAKALMEEETGPEMSKSPTLTAQMTQPGVILGTAAYMSPEQAKGKALDKRTDIWAFGCILYECLTGQRVWEGDTIADNLAKVLEVEPDWERLPSDTPGNIRRLLRRCLVKDPRSRLRDIGDALLEIRESDIVEVDHTASLMTSRNRTHLLLGGFAVLVLGIVIGWGLFLMLSRSSVSGLLSQVRFSITLPENKRLQTGDPPETTLAISPDGSRLVYVGGEDWRNTHLFTRAIDSLEIELIPGTEQARQPFFSPDGRWLAFFTRLGELKKVSLSGGEPIDLLREIPGSAWSFGSWGDDGRIIFSTWGTSGLKRISAEGGPVESLTTSESEWPLTLEVLPGSQVVLYTVESENGSRIVARRLNTGTEQILIDNASNPRYLTSGHLLFSREGIPMVVDFDLDRVATTGSAETVNESVRVDSPVLSSAVPLLAASTTGALVFAPAMEEIWRGTLVWVDRQGKVEEIASVPAISFLQLSPDGRRVALTYKQGKMMRLDILDLESKILTPHLATKSIIAMMPVWLPNGQHIVFSQCDTVEGRLYRQGVEVGGEPELLLREKSLWGVTPWSITSDGRYIAYTSVVPETWDDIHFYPLFGKDGESLNFLVTPGSENQPAFSPDGQWIAYTSDESGIMEVYVREFPGGGSKRKVSTEGGWAPLWSPEGDEIFYQSEDGQRMMTVEIDADTEIRIDNPRLLFEGPFPRSHDIGLTYDVSPDGHRFLMIHVSKDLGSARELIVIQNWFKELKRLVHRGK